MERISSWYKIDICDKCREEVGDFLMMHSGGVCPFCGHSSGCTVNDTTSLSIREIKHYPWWQLWSRKKTWEGANKESIVWLKSNGY